MNQAIHEARDQLIGILAADQALSYITSGKGQEWLIQQFRQGFKGFDQMSLPELFQATSDAHLARRCEDLLSTLKATPFEGKQSGVTKTVLQFIVLHDDSKDLSTMPLGDIAYECNEGSYVGGNLKVVTSKPVLATQLEEEASALGSAAAFFASDSDEEPDESTSASLVQPLPTSLAVDGQAEYLPGACIEEVGTVQMQVIVGDYEDVKQVPEWAWIERVASFNHSANGQDGIWEFVVNLANDFHDIPEKLKPVFLEANQKNLGYLVFHQG